MTDTALPAPLAAALDALLEGQTRKTLQERARRLSEGFRARQTSAQTIRDELDALAYGLSRLPATYAAAVSVLGRLRAEYPELAPRRVLDLGCGLGAGSFAALEVWPEIAEVVMVDHSAPFLSLARRLTAAADAPALTGAGLIRADLEKLPPLGGPFDLVVVNYALTEVPEPRLAPVLDAIWAQTGGALVLVEPGTPRDHSRLMTLRTRLVAAGGAVALPCPHDAPCPLSTPDWCHFAVRLPRSRDHKLLKGAEVPFEDEKYAYLVATRGAPARPFARLLRPPRTLKYGLALTLCGPDGIHETTAPKRDKPFFDSVRRKGWGDRIAPREDHDA